MPVQTDAMVFDVRGNIFQIDGTRVWDPQNPSPGTLSFNVTNGAGKWVDAVFEAIYPSYDLIWQTGRMNEDTSVSHNAELRFHRTKLIKIKRWAPGLFGIPGDGGGEAFFVAPDSGDVTINLTVIG